MATDSHAAQTRLEGLALLPSTGVHLRDGTWIRASTRHAALECASPAACELYDEARFRQRLGLAHRGRAFGEIAQETLRELRTELDAGRGKVVYRTQFEVWRNRQMQKTPRASTLNNFAAVWSRLTQVTIDRGWVSARAQIPKLSTRGIKSTPRPAFSKEEVERLLAFMPQWAEQGRLAVEQEIRPLLRDHVEILLLTSIRHGTEAMGLCWNHIEWHEHERKKYLRLWVAGKNGGRWLIAKHRAVVLFERLAARQRDLEGKSFETILESPIKQKVFRFSNGCQPHSFIGTF